MLAIYTVTTSKHEYAQELSGRSPSFNLYVSYITLGCDLLSSIVFLVVPMIVILLKEFSSSCRESSEGCAENRLSCFGKKEKADKLYYLFLVAPVICVTSHLGYILLAWTTQPSKSTTTLILYYFLFSYLYLMLRLTYKLGYRLIRIRKSRRESPDYEMVSQAEAERPPSSEQAPGQEVTPLNNKPIRVRIFILTVLLGIVYLGLAVIFTLVVYLLLKICTAIFLVASSS